MSWLDDFSARQPLTAEIREFLEQWERDVREVLSPGNRDWARWTPLGRAAWAGAMREMVVSEGCLDRADPELVHALSRIVSDFHVDEAIA